MIDALVAAVHGLKDLNKGQGKNKDHYHGAFNTTETDPAKFWDSLNKGKKWLCAGKMSYSLKLAVGTLAVNQGFMTPNSQWDCSNTKFADLKPKQQRIIKAALKCKNEPHSVIAIRGLCGSLFRVN